YQPHLPADLGFYDLRLPEVRQAQADLARRYGISGFCYYHYWFNGKRLLNRVFDEVLESGKPEFPFCICWANENWTRVWDGGDRKILMQQQYSEEDDLLHISWLIRAFKDPRYIRIHGKPLLLIYRASDLPDSAKTAGLWREAVRKAGIPGLYLCRVESFASEQTPPEEAGFDAAVEFQPDWSRLGQENGTFPDLHVFDYGTIVERMIDKPQPGYLRFPCVTPSWDNTPRRGRDGYILHGSTPDLYERWLKEAVHRIRTHAPEEKIVFINAWNEWAEGNHLEPDQAHGHGYLRATQRALAMDSEPAYLNEKLTERAVAAMEKDRLADAEKLFQAALSHVPAAPRTLQQYAALLFRQGKPGEAKDLLTQAIQADPSNAELHNDLGAVCHVSGDTAGAISHLEEALRIDPDCAPALKNLAEVLLENNQVEKAREVCRRLRSIYPDDVEASTLWDTFSRGPGEPEGEDSPSPAAHSPARTASRKRPEGLMCLMPFTTMTLSFLGVYNCACPDWIKTKIGDMGASSIADIWNSEQAQWIRSKMYEGNWKEICNWFCPHVINHEKTGRLYRYDELEAHDAVTPQLAEEIRQGKTRLDSSPAVFKLDNSQICNLSCIMCSRSFYREDPVLLEKTTEDLRRHLPGARRIVMSGFGDPLARPDTRSLLMDEGLGHLKFDLITNALLLPRFWDRIRHQNFGDLLVSIDAADKKTYETIRRGGVWEDLLESLSLIGENREKFDSVTLNMTVMRENYASIPAFIDFALSRGFKASFQRIRGPYPRQNIFDLPDEDALRTLRSIVDHELTVRDRSLVFFGDLVAPDEHAPATAEALHQEAVQLFEQGMLAEAIVAMERAVAGGPDNAVLLNDLGAMYHASGEGEKARACFEQATGIDPAYAPSLKNLIELLFADGQYDRARRMCARLLSSHPGDTEARALWADITSAPAADLDTDTANSIQRNRVQWSNYEWTEGGDEWSACWGGTEQLWKRTIQPRIASFLPAAHILEIAPGFGRCTQYLVPQCTKLTLVDLTEKCIEACRRRFRGHSHIRYFVNDGKSLDMLEDGSIDFAFSWDSLVHVEKDVMRSYLHELAAKLRPGGAGFLHHSNIGAFLDPATGKLTVENRHWRGENMSAQLFRDYCQEAGLKCVSQEILAWGGTVLNDCISVFVKEPGYDPKKTVVVENPDFMEESRGRKTPPDVYGPGRSQQHEAASVELGKSGETPGEGALHGGNAPCLLSIILPVKTGTDRAVRSIKSLLRGMPRNAVEIIVVAGAPGDPADDRLERLSHERLTVVIPEGPLTQVQGCGLAVQKAS
ncbi:MAG TPA: glycoside hydrolase family 99-like domain-containing protein, partial [Deltaproteobacteria bacterium]|nr:glycoside hydrolase family 99-like domain-containing protein [Deltaproteobacteria bacterium]